jgi:ribosomal protein S18 acetylase RimI-like enzyme
VIGREINIERELPSGVEVRQHTLAEWLQMRATLTETLLSTWDVHRKIVDVIVPEKALLGLYADGQSVACGMGVVDGALLGYFSIFTGLSVRRSGFGRAVMDALTQWGVERGATFGYLQVEGDNNPALAMYAKLGFEPCYTYKYYKRG